MKIMTLTQGFITIAVVMLGTMLTRFLPFIVFPSSKEPPKIIKELCTVLPYAVMGMLVIFGIKDSFVTQFHGLFEIIAIIIIVILHKWKKNTLLSIAVGTAVYMVMIQTLA